MNISWPLWFSALYLRGPSPFYILPVCKRERRKEAWIPLFTCQCRCSCTSCWCAAGAPVAASLAREITQSCSFGYILLHSASPLLFSILCLSLSYEMVCIFIRGSEPLWSVDCVRTPRYKLLIKNSGRL